MRLLLSFCLVAMTANAEENAPTELIKERQAVMKAMGAHMKAVGLLAAKKVTLPGHAEVHARSLVELTRLSRELFPKGTGQAVASSDTKDTVWTDEKKFAAALDDMKVASDKLLKAAQTGEGLKSAVDAVGDSCGSCHKQFRVDR